MLRFSTRFLRSASKLQVSLPVASVATSARKFSSDGFYRVSEVDNHSPNDEKPSLFSNVIRGEIIDNAVDLKHVRPGETIEVPYEVTVSHSFRDFWQSAFYSHDRINTSTPFARSLGLQDQVVPFSLMLFLAVSPQISSSTPPFCYQTLFVGLYESC